MASPSRRRPRTASSPRPSPLRAPSAFLELLEPPRVAVPCTHAEVGRRAATTTSCSDGRPRLASSLARFLPFGPCSRRARPLSTPFPFSRAEPRFFFPAPGRSPSRPWRRRPRPPHGAPPLSSLDSSHPRERVPLSSQVPPSPLTAAQSLQNTAAATPHGRRRPAPTELPPPVSLRPN